MCRDSLNGERVVLSVAFTGAYQVAALAMDSQQLLRVNATNRAMVPAASNTLPAKSLTKKTDKEVQLMPTTDSVLLLFYM